MYFSNLLGSGGGTGGLKYGNGQGIGGLLGGPQLPMAAKQNTGSGPIPAAPPQLPKDSNTLSALTESPLAMAQLKSLLGSNGNLLNYDRTLFGYGPDDFGGGSEYGTGANLGGGGGGGLLGGLLSYL